MDKGQSLVEFAISLLFLLFLLSGIADFGVLFFQYVQLRDAAQEGSVFASVCKPDCTIAEIEARARGTSNSPINLSDPNLVFVSISVTGKDVDLMCEGDNVMVQVSYNHKIFMPFLSQILGRPEIPLNGIAFSTVLVPVCP